MEDQSESIMKEMKETRSSMTDKLEALEQQVSDTIQPVTNAVERVSEAAASIVENVKETVHDVTEKVEETVESFTTKVEETVESVSSTFSISRHADRHPWVVFSAAATVGCVIGTFTGGRSRRSSSSKEESSGSRSGQRSGTNGSSYSEPAPARSASQEKQDGWFGEQIQHLKGFAVGTLMSILRDLAKRAVPGAIGGKIAEEIESLTTRMGASTIAGSVLPEESESKDDRERAKVTATGDEPESYSGPYNRLRSDGPGTGLL